MHEIEVNKISKSDFLKLKEEDVMFITNPGRMGDEDGSTFVVKEGEQFKIYRVDGWMYPTKEIEDDISLGDFEKQFPQWLDTWKHRGEDENGKYKYLYMGFGNGLSVDKSIYEEFLPYLKELVEKNLKDETDEEKEKLQYAAVFNVWEEALIQMIKAKKRN